MFLKLLQRKPLSGMEMLEKVYAQLVKRNKAQLVDFQAIPKRYPDDEMMEKLHGEARFLWFLIADDSDHHRDRRGWMRYDLAHIVEKGGQRAVIAHGRKAGSYPGDQYAGDLIVVPTNGFGKEDPVALARTVRDDLRRRHLGYFSDSIIVAMSDGSLKFPASQPGIRLQQRISGELRQTEPAVEDGRYIQASSLRVPVIREGRYHPSSVRVVVEGIEEGLVQS